MDRGQLTGSAVPVGAVDHATEQALYSLFERHYEHVSRQLFHRDLREKDWLVFITDSSRRQIVGFSTLQVLEANVEGKPVRAAFSGDTVVDRLYWGQQQLVKTWYGLMERLRQQCLPKKLYWFLISKGHRTYLCLPAFFKEFYPRWDKETPPFERQLIAALASAKYPLNFDSATGLVQFPEPAGNLRTEFADIPSHRQDDPHVRFFVHRNPRWALGSELCCIADFSPENLRPTTLRLVGAGGTAV